MKFGKIDRLIARLDKLEPEAMERLVLKAVEEKGLLERVFDALRDGVLVAGATGIVRYANQAAQDFLGLPDERSGSEQIQSLFPQLDWDDLEDGQTVINRDLMIEYPEPRYLNLYLSTLDTGDELSEAEEESEELGWVVILRDVTRERMRQLAEIETEKIEAVKSLAAGVAHELGNPLNSLNIHLQLVERKLRKQFTPEEAEPLLASLEIAQGEIHRLDQIVDQFLTAVRPAKPVLVPADLHELIQSSLNIIGPEVADRRIQLVFERSDYLPVLQVDGNQLKQVLFNLVRNSAQAIGSDGTITLRTAYSDESVSLQVADDGPGLAPDKVRRVFDPYFTTKEAGSGLGLMIVQRIIHEHGGEIAFRSEEGVGTEVTLYLPRAQRQVRFLPGGDEDQAIIEMESQADEVS